MNVLTTAAVVLAAVLLHMVGGGSVGTMLYVLLL